jgi:hypothetical protein
MPMVKLSFLAVVMGLGLALPQVYGLLKPGEFGRALRGFPRSNLWGYLFMPAATVWFVLNVRQEQIADFENMKNGMCLLFAAIGVGSCLFLKDFLAVRGLAVLFLLLAKLVVDSARVVDTDWRLVMVTWAYVLVVAGIWLTVSPWRGRDMIEFITANERRIRVGSAARLAFGLFVAVLGLTVLNQG